MALRSCQAVQGENLDGRFSTLFDATAEVLLEKRNWQDKGRVCTDSLTFVHAPYARWRFRRRCGLLAVSMNQIGN